MSVRKNILTVGVVVAIVGCGGGGSSTTSSPAPSNPNPPVVPASAEGVWTGTTSSGFGSTAIVLESNEVWNIFGVVTNGVTYLRGLDYGVTTLVGNSLTGTVRELYTNDTSVVGSLSATLNPGVSLSGSVTAAQAVVTFNSTPIAASLFNYNRPANITDVAGGWAGSFLNGAPGNIAITSAGVVTGSSYGCTFSGSIAPRASGKNIFNVSINFGGSPCLLPGQNTTGIGVITTLITGKQQFIVAALNTARTQGSVFVAQR